MEWYGRECRALHYSCLNVYTSSENEGKDTGIFCHVWDCPHVKESSLPTGRQLHIELGNYSF